MAALVFDGDERCSCSGGDARPTTAAGPPGAAASGTRSCLGGAPSCAVARRPELVAGWNVHSLASAASAASCAFSRRARPRRSDASASVLLASGASLRAASVICGRYLREKGWGS